jgi:hypothetical protein
MKKAGSQRKLEQGRAEIKERGRPTRTGCRIIVIPAFAGTTEC